MSSIDTILSRLAEIDLQLGQRRVTINGRKLSPREYQQWRVKILREKNELLVQYRQLKRTLKKGTRDDGK